MFRFFVYLQVEQIQIAYLDFVKVKLGLDPADCKSSSDIGYTFCEDEELRMRSLGSDYCRVKMDSPSNEDGIKIFH